MKKHVCAAALALCFVLAACAPEPGASSASVPSSSAAASSLPPASGTAGQAAPPLDLPYEKIQPVADHATPYPYLACGFDGSGPVYYTMCRGGLWGLMREDFTVVLECRAPQPVTRCHLGHWSWGSDGMNWDELDAVNARLSETGDGALEVGHGGSGTLFYWDVDASAPGFCRTGEAAQAPSPVTAADYERYGVFLPVQLSVMAESEMTGGLYPQPIDSAFCYNFAGPAEADAPHLLTEEAYEAVGWFREGLGSVYKNGKTAYLNAEGRAVTDFLYDGVWAARCATQSVLDEKTGTYADEVVYARPGAATRFATATPPCAGTGFGASSMPTARKLFPAATNTPVPHRMVLHWYAKTACGALLSPRHWRRELRFRACGATVKSAGQAAAAHLSVRLVQPRPPHAAARVRPFPLRETAPRPSRQEPGGARCCFLSLPMLTRQSSAQAAPAAKRTEWHVWSNTVRDFFVPVHSFSGPPPAAVRCVS